MDSNNNDVSISYADILKEAEKVKNTQTDNEGNQKEARPFNYRGCKFVRFYDKKKDYYKDEVNERSKINRALTNAFFNL